jgi:cytochrome c biogenesis protein CcmG/thiol:disulfide interchange protein DsbE
MQAILMAVLLLAQPVSPKTQAQGHLQKDDEAPGFTLKDTRGRLVRLGDYKGKVLLINFWATWCAPCQAEMPSLVELQKENRSRGLQIVGVTYPPQHRNSVLRVTRKFRLNYPVLFGTRSMTAAYHIGGVLPVTIVIDRDGKIRERILGTVDPEDFSEKVAPLLEPVEPNDVRKQ